MDMLGAGPGNGWSPQVADEERCVCGSGCFETSSFMPFMLEVVRARLFIFSDSSRAAVKMVIQVIESTLTMIHLMRLGKWEFFSVVEATCNSAAVGISET